MATPISSNNNPLGNIRQPTAAPAQRPPDSTAVDESAAEFAALLGAEPEQPRKADDRPSRFDDNSSSESSEARADSSHGEARVARRSKRDEHSGDDDQSNDEEPSPESLIPSFGDAILDGLSKTAGPVAVDAPPPADGAAFDNVVQQICDKILVSDPSSGTREVRIMLKESALPGTEIRILQEGGRLQVQFVTDNADVQNKLAQHQATLQTLLNEKLSHTDVVVEVSMESQGQDMGDGRSRQQRDAKEEYEREEGRLG